MTLQTYWIRLRILWIMLMVNCANMFTRDQRTRMLGYLNNSGAFGRASHISAATATATGINISNPCAPKADFSCKGFTDYSM